MNVYEKSLLPRLIDLVMRNKADRAERARLIPLASGAVLEVGIGSGLNLPFYGLGVTRLYAVDPSVDLWKLGRWRIKDADFPVEFFAASGERIPLGDATADTAVTTWTLCTIPDAPRALCEIRRVLKPEGRLIFVEHGRAPDPGVEAWQRRLNPAWRRLAGGCNLNRKIDDLIVAAGFRITRIEAQLRGGPKLLAYLYKGFAEPSGGPCERTNLIRMLAKCPVKAYRYKSPGGGGEMLGRSLNAQRDGPPASQA